MGVGRLSRASQSVATDAGNTYAPVAPPATNYNGDSGQLTQLARPGSPGTPVMSGVVDRHERRDGIVNHYVYGSSQQLIPFPTPQVQSSAFQDRIIRLFPWMINLKWYIAYPAATVMNGGKRNQGLSERTPQLSTRITGGPGYFLMGPRPQFRSVQNVPRYSSAPSQYKTKGALG